MGWAFRDSGREPDPHPFLAFEMVPREGREE
jgi:hypothetical protein